ncbi:hypothetical protein K1T71_011693 [Dendrolimus kikuchii]|uniref:Uncharacterized protein n=1 Tax=Dendrolimus kikuchii TaxID=765133 RepID=A0ACC1CMA9_9NEOP|nr:hypothetical protein K1T71_011693 [Dendrolimus kikuchii]
MLHICLSVINSLVALSPLCEEHAAYLGSIHARSTLSTREKYQPLFLKRYQASEMATLWQNTLNFVVQNGKCRFHRNVLNCPLLSCAANIVGFRNIHFQELNKNFKYISNEKTELKVDPVTMKLNKRPDRPLCIIMSWMMAKPKHTQKYAELYLPYGFDVVIVSCSPMQLMWPAKGSKVIAADLMKFIESNENFGPLVVHGFSVGAYLWAELLVQSLGDKRRYQPQLDRVAAQVWDSPADIYEIPVGLSKAVFPKNKLLQTSLRTYATTHMKVFHNVATKHYMRATEVYHDTPCHAPGLFLVSKTDPVGTVERSRRAYSMWVDMGIRCNFKCWDKSPHVQHYIHHPEEYLAALHHHLEECGIFRSQKLRMSL